MPRYVALLRGVSPMNCKMAELKACVEAAGYANVKTLLSSGNLVLDTPRSVGEAALERKLEAAMLAGLGRSFYTIVRPQAALQALLDADPFAPFGLAADAKRVVSFLRAAPGEVPALPLGRGQAQIHAVRGREVLSAYRPGDDSPVFMALIEKAFGKDITTRTWDTVAKCARA
ncbi:DUF1697 domain-containing protein [Pelomonas sp. KK5]|uniref:DUF1697 domain-containing protein n=1 Tax=Pelomonas sp. KK5 TaxID=1855730 RepID=UPI00097C1021|nr:DUF1697 domain-containing protein [Pelomonas sp. KK5]